MNKKYVKHSEIPHCQHCKMINVPMLISATYKNGIRSYMCRDCNTLRAKKYRNTEKGRERIRLAIAKSMKKHSDKQSAREKLNIAVKKGKIKRPSKCTKCKQEKKIEAHHSDYTKPFKVKWLCRQCHCALHKKDI